MLEDVNDCRTGHRSDKTVGSLEVVGGTIRYEIRGRPPEVAQALETLKSCKPEALAILSGPMEQAESVALESILKGRAVELWSDSAGRLFIVADEEDARVVMERFSVGRGIVYIFAEARRIVAIGDPLVVAEIHKWKRAMGGSIRRCDTAVE